jgi:diacylglycerol kinase family enzyme
MDDHHTRILVVGASPEDAQALAEGVAKDAFDNVAFFGGDVRALERALGQAQEHRAREAEGFGPAPATRLVRD